jgi:hypothetical protein
MILKIKYSNYKSSTYRIFKIELPEITATKESDLSIKEKAFIYRVINFYSRINEIVDNWGLEKGE